MTVHEAEILISANQEVRDLAESGNLKKIHENYNAIKEKVDISYL